MPKDSVEGCAESMILLSGKLAFPFLWQISKKHLFLFTIYRLYNNTKKIEKACVFLDWSKSRILCLWARQLLELFKKSIYIVRFNNENLFLQ